MIRELPVRPASEVYEKPLIAPLSIPSDQEIEALALRLHSEGQPVEDRAFGWDIYYSPAGVLPACFIIGDSRIWSVSYDWENGDEQPPYVSSTTDDLVDN